MDFIDEQEILSCLVFCILFPSQMTFQFWYAAHSFMTFHIPVWKYLKVQLDVIFIKENGHLFTDSTQVHTTHNKNRNTTHIAQKLTNIYCGSLEKSEFKTFCFFDKHCLILLKCSSFTTTGFPRKKLTKFSHFLSDSANFIWIPWIWTLDTCHFRRNFSTKIFIWYWYC